MKTVKSVIYRVVGPWLPQSVRDMLELQFQDASALVKVGWPESRRARLPVDGNGGRLPLYTYPAIKFLETRIPATARVFEYGMGYSTFWWSHRVARVEGCEHDAAWFARLEQDLPHGVIPHYFPVDSDEYVSAASISAEQIDILVIDGRRRVACAKNGIKRLSDSGVVIWDNTERNYYAAGFEHLSRHGFAGRIDFWGMQPATIYESCTSIFYRRDNCLGL